MGKPLKFIKFTPDSDDTSSPRVLSRKELAREFRRAAYQRAKKQRASDPKVLAMKEAAKVYRREAYRTAKERRKVDTAREKNEQAEREQQRAEESRTLADQALMKLLHRATGPYDQN